MIGIWTDYRDCIIAIIPNSCFFCLVRVAWIHFCSSSGTCALSWRSSNLLTLSCLGMIIFIYTFPWTLMSLSTYTSCHSGNTFCVRKQFSATVLPQYKYWSLNIMQQPSPWDALSEKRSTMQDRSRRNRFNQKAWQNQARYSFKKFDDQLCNWSTIKLPRNGAKHKCELLKSCQANASTKTRRKGCAG